MFANEIIKKLNKKAVDGGNVVMTLKDGRKLLINNCSIAQKMDWGFDLSTGNCLIRFEDDDVEKVELI